MFLRCHSEELKMEKKPFSSSLWGLALCFSLSFVGLETDKAWSQASSGLQQPYENPCPHIPQGLVTNQTAVVQGISGLNNSPNGPFSGDVGGLGGPDGTKLVRRIGTNADCSKVIFAYAIIPEDLDPNLSALGGPGSLASYCSQEAIEARGAILGTNHPYHFLGVPVDCEEAAYFESEDAAEMVAPRAFKDANGWLVLERGFSVDADMGAISRRATFIVNQEEEDSLLSLYSQNFFRRIWANPDMGSPGVAFPGPVNHIGAYFDPEFGSGQRGGMITNYSWQNSGSVRLHGTPGVQKNIQSGPSLMGETRDPSLCAPRDERCQAGHGG